MNRRTFLSLAASAGAMHAAGPSKPNILIFYIDDMGYAQPSCYGGKLAPTPNIDALAAAGVRFTDGYVAAPVCSPSRVGLLTGRYQARTGHDANTVRPGSELLKSEITIAQYMKRAGYVTGIVGKWHVGATEGYLPASRGFDYSVGATGNIGEGKAPGFYRGTELLETQPGAPVTTPFYVEEACRFIDNNKSKLFFLYLPFNAVHAPHTASQEWLAKFEQMGARRERAFAAQIAELDAGIGTVMSRLRSLGLEDNTLIFCISDNGGADPASEMAGLRGGKWNLYEGGIRVPYIVQWKKRVRGGQVSGEPVIQLDVLPTALAAAGADFRPTNDLDGVNLLPLLENKGKLNRQALYWRFGVQYAVRSGEWKLVKPSEKDPPMLFRLSKDSGEAHDLTAAEPERAKQLQALWESWNSRMQPPRWEDRRWLGDEVRKNRQGKKKKKGVA